MGSGSVDTRIACWLFVGLFGLYGLLGVGHITSPDGVVMSRVSSSLLDGGPADIQPLDNWETFGGSRGSDGRFYAKYGIAQSVAAIPTLLVGRILAPLVPASERGLFDTPIGVRGTPSESAPFGSGNPFRLRWYDWSASAWPLAFEAWTTSWTNAWVVAAIAAVLFLLGQELGYGVRASLGMALVAALATPLGHYARMFFSEPLAGLALVAFVLCLVRASRRERGTALWAIAGIALAATVLVKIAHAVLLVPGGLLVLGFLWRRGGSPVRSLVAFGLGVCVPLACIAAYDFARFGDIFETGYAGEVEAWTTPFFEGFVGLLASPGKGLLWFCPVVLASFAYGPRFAKRFPMESAFVGASLLSLLVLYARWHMWEGGWCWGPRFLVPVIPLLVLPVGALFSRLPTSAAPRVALSLLLLAALVVSWSGLLVNTMDFHNWVKLTHGFQADAFAAAGAPSYYDLVRWDWRYSPLVASWGFPIKDAILLPHAFAKPGFVLGVLALFAAGVAFATWRVANLLRTHPSGGAELVSERTAAVAP